GGVYQKIIQEVIAQSQNDFEESGVDQGTLSQLQDSWQQRLTAHNTAQYPWDPVPQQPLPSATNPPTLPSNATHKNQMSTPAYPPTQQAYGNVRIKAEPGTEPSLGFPQANGYPNAGMNGNVAQQRAMNLLQQQYGSQANASIGALQQQRSQGLALPTAQRPMNLQLPNQAQQQARQQGAQLQRQAQGQPQGQPQGSMPLQQQQQQQQQRPAAAQQHYLAQQQGLPGQTDGAGDAWEQWNALVAERRAVSDQDRAAADHMLRDHIEALAQRMDSGLMVPLNEQKHCNGKKRKQGRSPMAPSSALGSVAESPTLAALMAGPSISQLDGGDETDNEDKGAIKGEVKDEDVDEDAINSDLDDPDDDKGAGDEDEEENWGNTMLCTYDKVQRVKNKWKCTLKDGVLTTGGKEYLFHKAQGEFE
ncbi:transcription factor IIA subunit alpha, partial [Cryomyces antarcticus]